MPKASQPQRGRCHVLDAQRRRQILQRFRVDVPTTLPARLLGNGSSRPLLAVRHQPRTRALAPVERVTAVRSRQGSDFLRSCWIFADCGRTILGNSLWARVAPRVRDRFPLSAQWRAPPVFHSFCGPELRQLAASFHFAVFLCPMLRDSVLHVHMNAMAVQEQLRASM